MEEQQEVTIKICVDKYNLVDCLRELANEIESREEAELPTKFQFEDYHYSVEVHID